MGNKYSVFKWVEDERCGWVYAPSYQGESLIFALLDVWKCKRAGSGCVKLEVR